MSCLIPLTILSITLFNYSQSSDPIVSTNFGRIRGFEHAGADVFLAIPYARPPVDDLRFEKPVDPDPWHDIYSATQFRNDCTPHYRLVAQLSTLSGEDCLTLNIIRPKNAKNLPVLFWVHGGGYSIGSASQHGYKVFAEKYAPKGVIVVTIQYRLGFMGFFTDGTDEMPGNMGLFDQAAALRFVKNNIANFGGDPNRVTLWGYSAGGASVSQLTVSPQTRDLYAHAIIMSGSSFAGWSTGTIVVDSSRRLAKVVGCSDAKNVKQCMKGKSLEELFNAIEIVGFTSGTIDILLWAPIIGDEFLPKHPNELVKNAPRKSTIIGISNKEGSYFTAADLGNVLSDFGISEEESAQIDEQFVIDVIKNKLLYNNRFGNKHDEVLQKIVDFYLNRDRPEHLEGNGFFIDRYTQILSDIVFNVPSRREIKRRVGDNDKVWVYLFQHYNNAIWKDHVPEEARGSPHVNEYNYLFDIQALAKFDMSKDPEKRIQNDMIEMVVSFAKEGKPDFGGKPWNSVQNSTPVSFLDITTTGASEGSHLFEESLNFWNELRDTYNFDIVDPNGYPNRIDKSEL